LFLPIEWHVSLLSSCVFHSNIADRYPSPPLAKVPVEHKAKVSRRPRETSNISMYGFVCVPADESRRVGEMSVRSGVTIKPSGSFLNLYTKAVIQGFYRQ
jgi:hypothetical protein